MAARARRSGGWILMVGLLLVGAAAWFPLGGDDDAVDGLASSTAPKDGHPDAVMRTADGQPGASPASKGPVLVGHTAEPKPPVARANVTVTVVGLGARPLAGVRVELVNAVAVTHAVALVKQWGATDVSGEVVFADVALDGLSAARLGSDSPNGPTVTVTTDGQGSMILVTGAAPAAWTPIRQARVTLTVDGGLPLRIVPMGRPGVAARSLAVMGLTHRFPGATKTGLRTDGDEPVLALGRGSSFLLQYRLRREEDGGGATTDHAHSGEVHPQATRLVAHAPMPVDARVVVLIEDLPVELRGVPILWIWSWKHVHWQLARSEAETDDRHHLKGVPHLGGEIVKVAGNIGSYVIQGEGILPWRADKPLVIRATLLRGERGEANAKTIRMVLESHRGVSLRRRLQSVTADPDRSRSLITVDASFFVPSETYKPLLPVKLAKFYDVGNGAPPAKPAIFRIRCFQPNGEPAVGASVRLVGGAGPPPLSAPPAGADGSVRFESLAPGRHAVQIWGAGVPRNVPFDVPPSQTGTLDVRGTVGGAIDVEVLDTDGRPLPFARLAMEHPSGQHWVDLDGSAPKGAEVIQRIDPYVDAGGRRCLHGVQPGLVMIRATFGTRSAFVRVQVLDGRTHAARLVLPVLTLKSGSKPKAAGPQIVGPADER